jgi:hypothetical protein
LLTNIAGKPLRRLQGAIPCFLKKFPVRVQKFPDPRSREYQAKALEYREKFSVTSRQTVGNTKIPCFFSLLAGNCKDPTQLPPVFSGGNLCRHKLAA